MAEQWLSTAEHAPASTPPPAAPKEEWQSTADHAPAPSGSALSRFAAGTGIPAFLDHMTTIHPGEEPGGAVLKRAWEAVKSVGHASKAHLDAADEFERKGDYTSALGHAFYAIPGLGELGYQTANKFLEGDVAGGIGGMTALLGPKFVAKTTPFVKSGVDAAKTAIQETAASPRVQAALATAADLGKEAVKGEIAKVPGVATIKAGLKSKNTFNQHLEEITAAQQQAAAKLAQDQAVAASKAGPRVPAWRAEPPAPPAVPVDAPLISPEAARALAPERLAANRAARAAADPNGGAASVARIKALSLGDVADMPASEMASPPETTPVPASSPRGLTVVPARPKMSAPEIANRAARAEMIGDALQNAAQKGGFSLADVQRLFDEKPEVAADLITKISKTPEGTKIGAWWRNSTSAASADTLAMVRDRIAKAAQEEAQK